MSEKRRLIVQAAATVVLAAVYFCAAKLGLSLAFVHSNATAVWPPTGIALAAVLLWGYRMWPGVFAGAFFANLTTAGTIATSAGIATGNTLEAVAGAWLLHRFASGPRVFQRARDVFRFVILAALLSTAISATIGVLNLELGGLATWDDAVPIWMTWWLGNAVGALVVAPLLVVWSTQRPPLTMLRDAVELLGSLLAVFLVGQVVFGGWLPRHLVNYPMAFASIPPVLWAAFRFGPWGAVTATMTLSVVALNGALYGFGPFVLDEPSESLLLLQAFLGTVSVTALILACVVDERWRAWEALREAERRFRMLIEKSSDTTTLVDRAGVIRYVNPSSQQVLGYAPEELVGSSGFQFVAAEHVEEAKRLLEELMRRPDRPVTLKLRVRHRDGSWRWVEMIGRNLLRDPGVQAIVVNSRDITEQQQAEDQVQAALKEKEILLKEIHHRVKNNLQIISSLLNLQADTVKDAAALEAFRESQNRVLAMSLIHESLYGAEDLARVDARGYFARLAGHLMRAYGLQAEDLELELDVEDAALNIDAIVPCGLIMNELVANAIKHASADSRQGRIRISLRHGPERQLMLQVHDTGPGFPSGFDLEHTESLGLRLVNALTRQLHGTLTVDHGMGASVTVSFPDPQVGPPPAPRAPEPAEQPVPA
ncbi:MAG: MASE1 domain-containing protein [Candidatus Rokubacteria bacterium]|nr:MASE1 domain-containing protein [Candidatus Rokubacteria bacterium]